MNEKTVVITASPRRDGNCSRMAQSFMERLGEAGYPAEEYCVGSMKVSEFKAGTNEKYEKWFAALEQDVRSADAVVFVVPVYVYGYPAQLAMVIERLLGRPDAAEAFRGKKCMLISCCAQRKMSVFDGVKFTYEHLAERFGLQNAGELLVPKLWKTGDAARRGAAGHAYYFAENLIRAFRRSAAPRDDDDLKPGLVSASVIGSYAGGL